MGKFIITEEEKKQIRGLYEQQTTVNTNSVKITTQTEFSATDNKKPIGFSDVNGGDGVDITITYEGGKTKGGHYYGGTNPTVGFTYVNIPKKLNEFKIILSDKNNRVLATYGPFPTEDPKNYINQGLKFRGVYSTSVLPKGEYVIYVQGDSKNRLDIIVK